MSSTSHIWGIRKCEGLMVPGAHEAAADPDTLERVKERNKRQAKGFPQGAHPRWKNSPFLLTGVLRCGVCGASMVGNSSTQSRGNRRSWRHYICTRKVRQGYSSCASSSVAKKTLERAVMGQILDRVLTPGYMQPLLDEINARLSEQQPELERKMCAVGKDLARVNSSIEGLLDLAEKAGSEAARGRLMEREMEKATLLAMLKSLQAQKVQNRISLAPDALEQLLTELRAGVEEAGTQQRRLVLQPFVRAIEVEGKRVRMTYTFPLPYARMHSEFRWGH